MKPIKLTTADPLGSLFAALVAEGVLTTPGQLAELRGVTREAAVRAIARGDGTTVGKLAAWVEACGGRLVLTVERP